MPHKIKAYRSSVPHTKLKRTMKAFVKITATVFICIAALVPAVICARPAGLVPDNTHEIIKDPAFRNGFTLLSPKFSSSGGRIIVDTLVFTPKSAAPAWRMAQWHSRYDLADGKDRHSSIGDGLIGKEAFLEIVCHSITDGIPLVLETPDETRWKDEIAMLKAASEL